LFNIQTDGLWSSCETVLSDELIKDEILNKKYIDFKPINIKNKNSIEIKDSIERLVLGLSHK
jgi:hypothetical protein